MRNGRLSCGNIFAPMNPTCCTGVIPVVRRIHPALVLVMQRMGVSIIRSELKCCLHGVNGSDNYKG